MSVAGDRRRPDGLVLSGLDGGNQLAFLAALGALRTLTQAWPDDDVKMAWTASLQPGWRPVITASRLRMGPSGQEQAMVADALDRHLTRSIDQHPAQVLARLAEMGKENLEDVRAFFSNTAQSASLRHRDSIDWLSALSSDACPDATSQLQTARRDYFYGNVRNIVAQCSRADLDRSLFCVWDYGDALANLSLHVDPAEDRRYAYQWHQPTSDPTRSRQGGMLGANRLAVEAIPFFQSIAAGDKLVTRGFSGTRVNRVFWTWPIWTSPLNAHGIGSLLSLAELQAKEPDAAALTARGIAAAFKCRRILVEQTPNFAPSTALF
jgi:CRISPR-associated endonuclease/helicase Cas3